MSQNDPVFLFKVRRSRASSDWTLSVSRMKKYHRNRPVPEETSGSAAASQTSSPANHWERWTSRTLTITPPLLSEPPKRARSTHSPPERTCVGARSSFSMCPASLSSHWCLTFTHLRGARSVTSRLLTDLRDPNRRRLITGSSCREDSVTPCQCPPSCPAPRSSNSLLLLAPITTVLLPVTPASCPQHCQVSCLMRTSP